MRQPFACCLGCVTNPCSIVKIGPSFLLEGDQRVYAPLPDVSGRPGEGGNLLSGNLAHSGPAQSELGSVAGYGR